MVDDSKTTTDLGAGLKKWVMLIQSYLEVNCMPIQNECVMKRLTRKEHQKYLKKKKKEGFPGGAVVENLPANAGDTGSSPGLGRSHMPRSN